MSGPFKECNIHKDVHCSVDASEIRAMATENSIVIAFDLYGTLLSIESIAEALSSHFGKEKATDLAGLWRRYQLEYTWRLNSMSMWKHSFVLKLQ